MGEGDHSYLVDLFNVNRKCDTLKLANRSSDRIIFLNEEQIIVFYRI